MNKAVLFACAAMMTLSFSACKKNNENKFVEESSVSQTESQNNNEEIKSIDDLQTEYSSNSYSGFTYDGKNIYQIQGTSAHKGTVDDKELKIFCSIPGCKHNDFSCEQNKYSSYSNVHAYNGGMLYLEDNQICFSKDGKDKVIYTNDFTTKSAEELSENPKNFNSYIFMNKDTVAAAGYNFYCCN